VPDFPRWDPISFPGQGYESKEKDKDNGLSVYRFWIERRWSENPAFLLWVMFNPSVATIKSDGKDRAAPMCFQRSRRIANENKLDVGAIRIVNLFARRATDTEVERWPKHKQLDDDLWIGPGNDACIAEQASLASQVIVGWGAASTYKKGAQWRAEQVEAMLSDPWCLDHQGSSHPYYAGQRGARAKAGIIRLSDARQ
jgi:hypothetical protein